MGNICCGPREEPKVATMTLKQALLIENKTIIPPELFEGLKLTSTMSDPMPTCNSNNHQIRTPKSSFEPKESIKNGISKNIQSEEVKIDIIKPPDANPEILKIIENVKNRTFVIEALTCNMCQKALPPTKGSSYNENELKKDEIKGTLLMVDEDLMKKQRSVIGHIFKKFSLNLLQGKSLSNISFPVQVFEPRSVLQRVGASFAYAPNFLKKASETNDPLEQIKQVLSFMIAGLHLNITQRKPFNPILGETYEGLIGESPIYLEQVSHHPPISYFLVFYLFLRNNSHLLASWGKI